MIIGIPKEIKDHEKRVVLTPQAVKKMIQKGDRVFVEKKAGQAAGFLDSDYRAVGAKLLPSAAALYHRANCILKVKEPLASEFDLLRPGQIIFCFLHLAANPSLLKQLIRKRVTALAFETLEHPKGQTPILQPMSEIAGRLSVLLGANLLRQDQGGRGILLSPTAHSVPGKVLVIGGGHVGRAAAEIAVGLQADTTVLDLFPQRLKPWSQKYSQLKVKKSTPQLIQKLIVESDLVIGAIYFPGARAKKLISRDMVRTMKPGSVLFDVAVDQGGMAETTRPTSISNPVYQKYGVMHCGVTNLPALVQRTATEALSHVLLPYALKLFKKIRQGRVKPILEDSILKSAVNVHDGKVWHPSLQT